MIGILGGKTIFKRNFLSLLFRQKYPIPCIFSAICGGAFGALIAKFEINFGKFKRGKKKPSKII